MLRMNRRRWVLLGLFIPVLYAALHFAQWRVREHQYARTLKAFSDVLRPGMTRGDVERYLGSKNFEFLRECSGCDTLTDLVKISHENAGWLCIEQNVYAAFDFTATEPHDWKEARDSDRLVRVYPDRSVCLDLP